MTAVPQHYRGLWRRTLLTAPGVVDDSTIVLWMQTPQWHADLRIPIDRPDFTGCAGLEDCNADHLLGLLRQEGFAGITAVDGDTCEWHRQFDYRSSGSRDIGTMRFTPEGDAVDEFGVEADYVERWERVSAADGMQAVLMNADRPVPVVWLQSGSHFMRVRQRLLTPAETDAAWRALRAGTAGVQTLRRLADFAIDFGDIEGTEGCIRHSTLPWREGARLSLPEHIFVPYGGPHCQHRNLVSLS